MNKISFFKSSIFYPFKSSKFLVEKYNNFSETFSTILLNQYLIYNIRITLELSKSVITEVKKSKMK